ncbi:MAG: adenylate/guanylate cyclase domain-containing protein [Bacteroidales bacterium]
MNFKFFLSKQLIIFFIIQPFGAIASWEYPVEQLKPDPIVNQITNLPKGFASGFSTIVSEKNGRIILYDDSMLWLFDGHSWESIPFSERPVCTFDINDNLFVATTESITRIDFSGNDYAACEMYADKEQLKGIGDIMDFHVNPDGSHFIQTSLGIWHLSDTLVNVDSSSGWVSIIGDIHKPFFVKRSNELYTVDSTYKSLIRIAGTRNKNFIQAFSLKDDEIAITRSFPWIQSLKNTNNVGSFSGLIEYLDSFNPSIVKANMHGNRLYLLTLEHGYILVDCDTKSLISHVRPDSFSDLGRIIDIFPHKPNVLFVLSPTGIYSIQCTYSAGVFRFNSMNSNMLGTKLVSSNKLLCGNTNKLFMADYSSNEWSLLSLEEIVGANGPFTKVYKYEDKLYAAGLDGIYRLVDNRAYRVPLYINAKDFEIINFTNFNDNIWLVTSTDNGFVVSPVDSKELKTLDIPLPSTLYSIKKIEPSREFLFILLSNGSWYQYNMMDNEGWVQIFEVNQQKKNLSFLQNNRFSPYVIHGNGIYRYDSNRLDVGELVAIDSTGHLLPVYENDSILIVNRTSNAFPYINTLWAYSWSETKNQYTPQEPLAIIPTKEEIKEVSFTHDSTLFVTTNSAIFYFRSINKKNEAPSVSISSAYLRSQDNTETIKSGYVKSLGGDTLKKHYRARDLSVAFASNGSAMWNQNPKSVVFSSNIDGYDKEWTPWTNNNVRLAPHLKPGKYTLHVKAKNVWGIESDISKLTFVVKPRFYETPFFWTAFAILGLLGLYMVYKWRRYLHAKVRFKLESLINKRTEELVKEKEKTENLLVRVLPKDTASELKEKGRVNTQRFQVVTVLFCDIEGFTRITDETNPEVLIDQLDKFFLYFDSVVEKYKIEKIKTIGDAYMCAGGIPQKNRTNPVEVVLAALEMMHYMNHITRTSAVTKGKVWELRIGIDTGPVIAGVVGRSKLSYDIWGSTVNTASRMESSGEVGQINISGNTYMLVKDYFVCTYRGKMPVKNKGDIQMYFINGIKPSLSENMEGIIPNDDFRTLLQLIRLGDLEDFILDKLEKGLPKNLYYHNLKHTIDVYTQVELIGRSENVSKEQLLLLRSAALFHDAGHLIDYDTHEEMGVKLAREILPEFHYTEKQIEMIGELIMSTQMPPSPKNLLEEIMCDADLDYLGRPDFIPVSNMLYRELHEHGKVGTLREWNQLQIKFIDKHSYFTNTARRLRNVNKQSQLEKLKVWMEKN